MLLVLGIAASVNLWAQGEDWELCRKFDAPPDACAEFTKYYTAKKHCPDDKGKAFSRCLKSHGYDLKMYESPFDIPDNDPMVIEEMARISGRGIGGAQTLTQAQSKQLEGIAKSIAAQSNANKQAMTDDMTVSFNATAVGRMVLFNYVIRVQKGPPPSKIKEWLAATRNEIIPKACLQNAKNPAFERGLSYSFLYSNTYGEYLGSVFVDKAACNDFRR